MENNETRPGSFWSDARPLACGLAIVAGLFRFVPYLFPLPIFHFMPIGALGLFGGARLNWRQAVALPVLVMAATDLVLWQWKDLTPFDPFVYGSFLVNVLLGRLLLSRTESPWRIGSVSLLASIQFFVITNFGVWVTDRFSATPMYAANLGGLLKCYALGLAFYKTEAPPLGFVGNALLGDLFFTAVLFGAHAILTRTAFPAERVRAERKIAISHA
ncbi:MAG TPA: DUF6580 family putative transport protein [Gemmataceae bacterium]